jgi:excinuclease UvrABC helicase subunit UvrB
LPSRKTIAAEIGLSEATVIRSVRRLSALCGPLWVVRPTAKQVNDLLKFGPGTRGTSIENCREAVIERR